MDPLFQPEIVKKDWKYHLWSAFKTFLAVFLPLLLIQLKDLDLSTVKADFVAGGFIVATRAFIVLIISPLARALWESIISLLSRVTKK